MDASAHAVVDSLRERGLSVEDVSFSLQGKIELHSRLKSAFEGGRIVIPRHPDLLRQLASFRYKITDAGNLTLHGGRDDYVDSLALSGRDLTKPIDFGEPRSLMELFQASAEALQNRDALPAGRSPFDPRVADARQRGFGWGEKMADPRCSTCGIGWRTGSHIGEHRKTDCPEAGREEI